LLLGSLLLYRALPTSWFRPTPTAAQVATSGTSHQTRKIEEIRVGDRVLADNPSGDQDLSLGEDVDPATWRKIELRAPKRDGSWAEVVLLRPVSWLEEEGARVGATLEIAVPECDIDGHAEVLSIGPCPPIRPGPGRVVTGEFRHSSARIVDVYVEGQTAPIGSTANHLFWSEDRQGFLRADSLRPGERLRGIASSGRVERVDARSAVEAVYNLEVQGTHVYHVTQAGVVVHNASTRTGYVYEIAYVENGLTKVYVGSTYDVYVRLWTNKHGQSPGNRGYDILNAHQDAQVRIWQLEVPSTGARGALNTQEQHVIEDVINDPARGPGVLDNDIKGRNKRPGGAFTDSDNKLLSEAQQMEMRAEIARLQTEGRKLPESTPPDTPIERMSKYDRDTLRYGNRLGKPVADGPQATVKEQARLLCR
jgi:hypothetical protein